MSMLRLDGKPAANALHQSIEHSLKTFPGQPPRLVVILVGDNAASHVYVNRKMKVSQQLGMQSETVWMDAHTTQEQLLNKIQALNEAPDVDAILVQLPLPAHLDSQAILDAIAPEKDVDGFHPHNVGQLLLGMEPTALPCTPAGIMRLLDHYDLSVAGRHAVVIGRSNIVGKPISLMLLHRNATVTVCHSRTQHLPEVVRTADIIVAAIGRPCFVKADWVKPGAVIIDVGINRLEDGSLVGDVDYDPLTEIASAMTPVPGGVGPMTIAMLMLNTLRLASVRHGLTVEPWLMTPPATTTARPGA